MQTGMRLRLSNAAEDNNGWQLVNVRENLLWVKGNIELKIDNVLIVRNFNIPNSVMSNCNKSVIKNHFQCL